MFTMHKNWILFWPSQGLRIWCCQVVPGHPFQPSAHPVALSSALWTCGFLMGSKTLRSGTWSSLQVRTKRPRDPLWFLSGPLMDMNEVIKFYCLPINFALIVCSPYPSPFLSPLSLQNHLQPHAICTPLPAPCSVLLFCLRSFPCPSLFQAVTTAASCEPCSVSAWQVWTSVTPPFAWWSATCPTWHDSTFPTATASLTTPSTCWPLWAHPPATHSQNSTWEVREGWRWEQPRLWTHIISYNYVIQYFNFSNTALPSTVVLCICSFFRLQ